MKTFREEVLMNELVRVMEDLFEARLKITKLIEENVEVNKLLADALFAKAEVHVELMILQDDLKKDKE